MTGIHKKLKVYTVLFTIFSLACLPTVIDVFSSNDVSILFNSENFSFTTGWMLMATGFAVLIKYKKSADRIPTKRVDQVSAVDESGQKL